MDGLNLTHILKSNPLRVGTLNLHFNKPVWGFSSSLRSDMR